MSSLIQNSSKANLTFRRLFAAQKVTSSQRRGINLRAENRNALNYADKSPIGQ
jgi:hypothetical protein